MQASISQSKGKGGFTLRTLTLPSGASVTVCDYGAHLLGWQSPDGEQQLFLSDSAEFKAGKAIRGGIPLIFPQFNAFGPGKRHGFARNTLWHFDPTPKQVLRWSLNHYDVCDAHWTFPFQAYLSVALTDNVLNITLDVNNIGNLPFSFTAALHSYFHIGHLKEARLLGLKGLAYWDNDGAAFSRRQTYSEDILFFDDAIDRVFFDVCAPLKLVDGQRKRTLSHPGFSEVVVWNPGKQDAAKMTDLDTDSFQNMLCVEAATIDTPIELEPETAWQGSQTITIES